MSTLAGPGPVPDPGTDPDSDPGTGTDADAGTGADLDGLREALEADLHPLYAGWLTTVLPDRSLHLGSRAVDLGCGTGRFADLLLDRYQYVLGVDTDQRAVTRARARHGRPRLRFEQRDLRDVATEIDGQWDLVLAVDTLGRLPDDDTILPHLHTLLAPGADLLICDTVDPGGWDSLDWHVSQAFADAEDSYRHRTRELRTALDILRLRLHPGWLRHLTTTAPPTREQFYRRWAAAFPGATFTELRPTTLALHWRSPG